MQRSEQYYFEDGTVTLLVDQKLYNVHRYYLMRESEVFNDMFSLPSDATSSHGSEGRTDQSPIVIPEVSYDEIESFLGFVYFSMHDDHRLSIEDWTSLLSFATRFMCEKIRARAIREIEEGQTKLDPVQRVVLAIKHSIPQWLIPAYQELCQRQDSLTQEEGEKLGLSTVIKLMRARETLMNQPDAFFRPRLVQPQVGVSSSSQSAFISAMRRTYTDVEYDVNLRFDAARVTQVVKQVFELE